VIKAVLDTNTLASGLLTNITPPGKLIDLWRAGAFELILSTHLLAELRSTLQKPYFQKHLSSEQIDRFELTLIEDATFISPTDTVHGVATHPEDDLILATAASGKADYLVTGDKPLRTTVIEYQGVTLVTPTEFVVILNNSE
jgi:putative PIN family toxin of toxin-antitoxin system